MPETADRIESLFAATVALAPEELGAYLARECSSDPALQRGIDHADEGAEGNYR
jgi:hypothetical protein